MNTMPPCKDCDRRTITCHTVCREYKQYRKEQDERLQQKYEAARSQPRRPRRLMEYIKRNEK